MEDTAPLRTSTVTLPPLPRTHGNAPDNATIATDRRSLLKKRAAVIVGLLALTAGLAGFCVLYGPELLAFVADAPRFRAWVDETGWISRIVFVLANMAQVVFAFLPGEPLELGAGYAFGFWRGALLYLGASVLGCFAIIGIVHVAGDRVLRVLLSDKQRDRFQNLKRSQKFDLAILIAFFIPGLPKDILAYGAALAGMRPAHLVTVTTLGRLPSVLAATLASSFAAGGDWRAAALVFAAAVAFALAVLLVYHRVRRSAGEAPKR